MKEMLAWALWPALLLVLLLVGPATTVATGMVDLDRRWWEASRESAGLIPPAADERQAAVRVFGARAVRWRGAFAIHTWIAFKPEGAEAYTRHEVIGWRYYRGLSPVASSRDPTPDRFWFGNPPEILAELTGEAAAAAIPRIEAAIAAYPFADLYRTWPGPNSNTFVAWIGREVPSLGLNLPPTAIGKDFLADALIAAPPSGRGVQVSLFGLLGLTLSPVEGLEVNLLGLAFGVEPAGPALRLPGLGRVRLLPS
ncbi:MAG: DUF3750 domain-containing protein [Proteobacteria bacterium]|nr:DUF3750 domain-containing protein [Pseudomonadota bacterium]